MSGVSVQRVGGGTLSAAPPNEKIVPGGNPALWENVRLERKEQFTGL